jgi:hypothetical protein
MRSGAVTAVFLTCLIGEALADNSKAQLSRRAFAAFECAAYAELAGNHGEQQRLFEVGIGASREFVDALLKGQISKADILTVVPVAISNVASGPSADFIVGRIYDAVTGAAYDKVVKDDSEGVPLPVDKWLTDSAVRKPVATAKFDKGNCVLLK